MKVCKQALLHAFIPSIYTICVLIVHSILYQTIPLKIDIFSLPIVGH